MGLAAKVFGRKSIEVIEDFRGWFADRFAGVAAIDGPLDAKRRHVLGRAPEWMHREIALGHAVTSEWPPEVQATIAKIDHEGRHSVDVLRAGRGPVRLHGHDRGALRRQRRICLPDVT
jgi:hypothetical protein